MKAIFTASARHISRLQTFKKDGEIVYLDQRLNNLKIESAVEYHSDCIKHLALSDDVEAASDENLIAASVILRFYEEIDGKS